MGALRRVDPAALEPIAARAWPAAEEGRIGGWRLHATDGYSRRINACWPLADPGMALAEAVTRAEAWYAARGRPAIFKLMDGDDEPADLATHLAGLGYRPHTRTLVMTGPASGEAESAVCVHAAVDDTFEAVFAAAGAGDPGDTRERLETLRRVPAPRAFALAAAAGAPAAIGACAVEGEWAGVFAMRTAPLHRRAGHARRVLSALMAAARQTGARRAWLQVEADNAPALALYNGLGFEAAYGYRYWSRAIG